MKHKGGITIQQLVLIVLGIAVIAVTIATLQGGIENAYAQALENSLQNSN